MDRDPQEKRFNSSQLLALSGSRTKGLKTKDFIEVIQSNSLESLLDSPKLLGNEEWASKISAPGALSLLSDELRAWESGGIKYLPITSPGYPERLRAIHEPPLGLFVRGNWSPRNQLAIVGSRRADLSSCDIAESFAQTLCAKGLCIVSGLALGVDAAAHRGALKSTSSFPTIAVLGGGVDKIYPRSNEKLADQILEQNGALISQFEPGSTPYPQNFLNRNRVIAGLSKGVMVIAAGKRSGSLSTARHAMEEGREVYVIPGTILNTLYEGSNKLIQSGAALVASPSEILADFPEVIPAEHVEADDTEDLELTSAARSLLKSIGSRDGVAVEELASSSKEPRMLCTHLLELELAGYIRRLPGNLVSLRLRNKP